MSNKQIPCAPVATIRRIAEYLRVLEECDLTSKEWVSATDIAQKLDLKPIQVRKDIGYTGFSGKPKKGYERVKLIASIVTFLGWEQPNQAVLIGAGALGSAILGYKGFKDHSLDIIAAFDKNPKKIGTVIRGRKVRPLTSLQQVVKKANVLFGIITVPAVEAQSAADLLVETGIKGIWNFSPVKLNVPADVTVQREDLCFSLAILSVKISGQSG